MITEDQIFVSERYVAQNNELLTDVKPTDKEGVFVIDSLKLKNLLYENNEVNHFIPEDATTSELNY